MPDAIARERQRRDLSDEALRNPPPGSSVSLDAERERFLIAKALFIGANEIVAGRHVQQLEAKQMREILEQQYPAELARLLYAEALKRALWLGFIPTGAITLEVLNAFLAPFKGNPAVDLDDDLPF